MAAVKESSNIYFYLLSIAASDKVNGDVEADEDQEEVTKDGLIIPQLDGHGESSDDMSDGLDDDLKSDSSDEDFDTEEEEALDGEIGIEMEPPGSGDDVSDEEAADLFDTENVVVCQYEKISRTRNKWKLSLKVGNYRFCLNLTQWNLFTKDGVMNLNGQEFIFKKLTGEAEW